MTAPSLGVIGQFPVPMLRRTRQTGIFAAYFHAKHGGTAPGRGARERQNDPNLPYDMMTRTYLDPIRLAIAETLLELERSLRLSTDIASVRNDDARTAFQAGFEWMERFVTESQPQLGRKGAVCPFVQPVHEDKRLYFCFRPRPGNGFMNSNAIYAGRVPRCRPTTRLAVGRASRNSKAS